MARESRQTYKVITSSIKSLPEQYENLFGTVPPPDVPPCGFKGELCIKDETTQTIIWSILGGMTVFTIIILVFVYRQRKYEQALEGLVSFIHSSFKFICF